MSLRFGAIMKHFITIDVAAVKTIKCSQRIRTQRGQGTLGGSDTGIQAQSWIVNGNRQITGCSCVNYGNTDTRPNNMFMPISRFNERMV